MDRTSNLHAPLKPLFAPLLDREAARSCAGSPQRDTSIRSNFLWLLFGNLAYAASQWGLLVLLAKLTSPVVLGRFSIGLAIATPIVMFSTLCLSIVQATDAKDEYSFSDYLGVRLLTNCAAFLIMCCVVPIYGLSKESAIVTMIVGVSRLIEATSEVMMGWLQEIRAHGFDFKISGPEGKPVSFHLWPRAVPGREPGVGDNWIGCGLDGRSDIL